MAYLDWNEELRRSYQEIETHRSELDLDKLGRPISTLVESAVCIFQSTTSLREASEEMEQRECEFALVQDSQDTINGVLRRNAVHAALVAARESFDSIPVSNVMDRRVCVEPDTASISEVLSRMAVGRCSCTVVVDPLGRPYSIVTPKSVLTALHRLFPDQLDQTRH